MKKFFTLALTLFILNAAFSQAVVSRAFFSTPRFSVNFSSNNVSPYAYNSYQDNYEIRCINERYNQDVSDVMNLHISAGRKMRLIRQLEIEREHKIEKLTGCVNGNGYSYNNGYSNQHNSYNNQYYNNGSNWNR